MASRKAGKKVARKGAGKKKAARRRAASPRKVSARKRSAGKGAPSPSREEQHRRKREAILRVASRLINQKSYAGMSLADVADELAIKNASLYYYFDSKEDLVFACYQRAQRIVAETLESVEKRQGSGLEAIERYVLVMRERMREVGELPLADRVWALQSTHMRAIMAAERNHHGSVARLVERGIQDGSIRACNAPLATTMLISALRSVLGHYLSVGPDEWSDLDGEVLVAVRRFLGA